MKFKWTDEKTATAIKLWNENLRTVDIARAIGCSRNALIGKSHRELENFPKRSRYAILSWHEAVALYPHLAGLPRVRSKAAPLKKGHAFYSDSAQTSLEYLTKESCRWPLGDGFCNNVAVKNRPYCKKHTQLSKAEE